MAVFCRKECRSYDPKWHVIFYSFCGFVNHISRLAIKNIASCFAGTPAQSKVNPGLEASPAQTDQFGAPFLALPLRKSVQMP